MRMPASSTANRFASKTVYTGRTAAQMPALSVRQEPPVDHQHGNVDLCRASIAKEHPDGALYPNNRLAITAW
ncbi:MAG: hypothetical protein NVS4B8_22080 [Herpetosiphon sp.]